MDEDERKLLERIRRFVAATCPNLSENERFLVESKIYSEMRFTLKLNRPRIAGGPYNLGKG
jgi:hypothetical protein